MKNAAANLEGAKARVEQARKAYENSKFTAPVSGQIVDLPIQVGQTVSIGSKIATIVDTKHLMIKTGIGESFITLIKNGSQVEIIHDNSNQSYNAYISGIGLKPLPNTANYPLEISLSSSNGLLPGMVVDAKILAKTYNNVLYTSYNNLIQEYDNFYLFTIDSNNIAHRTKIKIGRKINEAVIIESGINPDDIIVTEGFENLEEGTKVIIRK
jgi:RND family efflux transporter MFP subunit